MQIARRIRSLRRWLLPAMLGWSVAPQAANWDIVPRLLLNETYSDNVNLSRNNANEDFITQLTPGLSIRGQGGRVELNLDYNFQNLMYARDNNLNNTNQQLQANASAELYQQVLFLDVSSQISQQLVSTQGVISDNNINATGNRADVMSYQVSPYVKHHFGGYADAEGRLTFNQVFNSATNTTGTVANNAASTSASTTSFNMTSGRYFNRIPWTFSYRSNTVSNDSTGGADTKFRSIEANISYVISRRYRLTSLIGNDDNTFSTSQRSTGGNRWEIGAIWTPSSRTRVVARWGDRYFGRTFFLDASHTHRHFVFTAHYDEQTQSLNDIQINQQLIPLVDAFGQPVFDPNVSSNIALTTDRPGLQNDVIVNQRLDINLAYSNRRNSANVGLYNSTRTGQASNSNEDITGLRASFSRQLSEKLTATINADWTSSDFQNGQRTDNRYGFGAHLTRRLGRHMNGIIDYRYRQSDSDSTRNTYTENRLSASLNLYY